MKGGEMMDKNELARDFVIALIQADKIRNITEACNAYCFAVEAIAAENEKFSQCR